jgi:hypothetical protein
MLQATKGKVYIGGNHERLKDGVRIEPTFILDVGLDDALMQELVYKSLHPFH